MLGEQSQQTIKEFLVAWWADLSWKAQETLLGSQLPRATAEQLYESGFGGVLRQMAAAAEGKLERNEVNAGEVSECVQQVCEWLWARPTMPSSYYIPEEFWRTDIGTLTLKAHLWCRGDELITATEAAKLSGKSLSALSQLANRGKLTAYPDPTEPNPQRRNRYSHQEVLALKKPTSKKKTKR